MAEAVINVPPAGSPGEGGPTGNLTRATVRGVGWTGGAQVVRQVLQLATTIVVARLLLPEDFGQVAQVTVLANFANILGDFGLGAALVQRTEIDERHPSTVFWAQAGLGLIVTVAVALSAPLIAALYNEPDLRLITLVLAPNFLLSSLCTTQRAMLTRAMRFRSTALADMASLLVSGIACVVAAAGGLGVMAIVTQHLVATATTLVMLWTLARWRPKRIFDREALRSLLPFSSNLLGYTMINYWIRHGDNLLVGRLMGATALGLYTRGYSILLYPTRQVSAVVGKVMFASLSRINDDTPRLRRAYLRAVAVIALLTFPMMIGLALVADEFVHVVLGSKWDAAIPIIRIFAVMGAFESVIVTVGWVYQSTGRTDVLLRWSLIVGGIPLGGITLGALAGSIEAVTLAYAASVVLLVYPTFRIAGRLIDMQFSQVVRSVMPAASATAVMAAAVVVVGAVLPDSAGTGLRLAVQVAVGAVAYAAHVHLRQAEPYVDARRILERRARGSGSERLIWHDPVLQLKLSQLRERRRQGATGGVLFAGTSQVLEGVDPSVVAPSLGLRAYNAGIHRGTMTLSEIVLPEVILPIAQPRLVVLSISPVDVNRHNMIRIETVERFERSPARRGLRGRVLRVAHERSAIVRLIAARLPGTKFSVDRLRIGPDGSGREFADATEYRMSEAKERYIREKLFNDFEFGPETIGELERTIRVIEATGARIVLVDMPVTDEAIGMLPRTWEDQAEYRRILADVSARLGVRVIEDLRDMTDQRWYADCVHLNGRGMAEASARLARSLADELEEVATG